MRERVIGLPTQYIEQKGCRTILRVSYFTKIKDLRLREPQEDKGEYHKTGDYLPARIE
jgi:hypothetical protein